MCAVSLRKSPFFAGNNNKMLDHLNVCTLWNSKSNLSNFHIQKRKMIQKIQKLAIGQCGCYFSEIESACSSDSVQWQTLCLKCIKHVGFIPYIIYYIIGQYERYLSKISWKYNIRYAIVLCRKYVKLVCELLQLTYIMLHIIMFDILRNLMPNMLCKCVSYLFIHFL